jgi:hypothetical protein
VASSFLSTFSKIVKTGERCRRPWAARQGILSLTAVDTLPGSVLWRSTTPWRCIGEWMNISTCSWARHWSEPSGQLHSPVTSPQGREPSVLVRQETWWTLEPVWTIWREENYWSYMDPNSEPKVFQPVISRYTDCAIPAAYITDMMVWICIRTSNLTCMFSYLDCSKRIL